MALVTPVAWVRSLVWGLLYDASAAKKKRGMMPLSMVCSSSNTQFVSIRNPSSYLSVVWVKFCLSFKRGSFLTASFPGNKSIWKKKNNLIENSTQGRNREKILKSVSNLTKVSNQLVQKGNEIFPYKLIKG